MSVNVLSKATHILSSSLNITNLGNLILSDLVNSWTPEAIIQRVSIYAVLYTYT